MVGEGVADHAGGEGAVGLRLADAGVRAHGGADEEAVGGKREQGLRGGGVVRGSREAGPDVELRRADLVGIGQVDATHEVHLPLARFALVTRGRGGRARRGRDRRDG